MDLFTLKSVQIEGGAFRQKSTGDPPLFVPPLKLLSPPPISTYRAVPAAGSLGKNYEIRCTAKSEKTFTFSKQAGVRHASSVRVLTGVGPSAGDNQSGLVHDDEAVVVHSLGCRRQGCKGTAVKSVLDVCMAGFTKS
jgi:hypothetical protein